MQQKDKQEFISSWMIHDGDDYVFTDEADKFIELLSIGVSKSGAAREAGVEESLVSEWLKDSEFNEELELRKQNFKNRIKNSIIIKPLTRDKENAHKCFSVSCGFMFSNDETEDHKKLIIKQYLKEIKKAAMSASIPKDKKSPKKTKNSKKIGI